ncbi:L,D-transpeptidase family protein [Halomonas korlensis]|uniref:L,D-transpeptidase catalytic domain n=1 Tax=Halomonas korlensis TaxID=463301 RepID=A0A1I7FCP8_9GAMM|nr:L,D-transpeptidase [Halomonas korlensis]SFU34043.1 L,D-transpeptidase catalytic domain [Halomonas korlensis]
MPSLSRRHFTLMALAAPLSLLGGKAANANLVDRVLLQAIVPRHDDEVWVLVDDREAALSVYRGNYRLEHFSPISLGRGGASPQRLRGDRATPLGEFRVNRFNRQSKFHIFIGLDYPTPTHARMALESGVYDQQDYDNYFVYYRRHGYPPQDTVLGGYIGIHGVGNGDPDIHERFHWTDGCVAVTDVQVERLTSLIDIGTRVVIR